MRILQHKELNTSGQLTSIWIIPNLNNCTCNSLDNLSGDYAVLIDLRLSQEADL